MARVTEKKKPMPKFRRASISVGIQAQEGGSQYEGGLSILEVAEKNEFGLGVPARPFMRQWADENQDENLKIIAREISMAAADGNVSQHLERAALALEASCKQYIAEGSHFTPNSPVTVARKGSSTPLIDTGALRASISGKVNYE